jgi:hypothetical protein
MFTRGVALTLNVVELVHKAPENAVAKGVTLLIVCTPKKEHARDSVIQVLVDAGLLD